MIAQSVAHQNEVEMKKSRMKIHAALLVIHIQLVLLGLCGQRLFRCVVTRGFVLQYVRVCLAGVGT